MQRTAKLTMQPAFGQPTTRQRGKTYKTIERPLGSYTRVKVEGAPVPTWIEVKIKK